MAHLFGTILKQRQFLIQRNLYKSSQLKEVLQQLLPSVLLFLSRTDIQLIVDVVKICIVQHIIAIIAKQNAEVVQYNSTLDKPGLSCHVFHSHTRLESVKPFLENAKCPLDSASCFLMCLIKPAASPFYVSSEWGDQPTVTGVGRVA